MGIGIQAYIPFLYQAVRTQQWENGIGQNCEPVEQLGLHLLGMYPPHPWPSEWRRKENADSVTQ